MGHSEDINKDEEDSIEEDEFSPIDFIPSEDIQSGMHKPSGENMWKSNASFNRIGIGLLDVPMASGESVYDNSDAGGGEPLGIGYVSRPIGLRDSDYEENFEDIDNENSLPAGNSKVCNGVNMSKKIKQNKPNEELQDIEITLLQEFLYLGLNVDLANLKTKNKEDRRTVYWNLANDAYFTYKRSVIEAENNNDKRVNSDVLVMLKTLKKDVGRLALDIHKEAIPVYDRWVRVIKDLSELRMTGIDIIPKRKEKKDEAKSPPSSQKAVISKKRFESQTKVPAGKYLSTIREFQRKLKTLVNSDLGVDGDWGAKSSKAWIELLKSNKALSEAISLGDSKSIYRIVMNEKGAKNIGTIDSGPKTSPKEKDVPTKEDAPPKVESAPPIEGEKPGQVPDSSGKEIDVSEFVVATLLPEDNPKKRGVALLNFRGNRPEGIRGGGDFETLVKETSGWKISSVTPVERRMLMMKSKGKLEKSDRKMVRKKMRRDNRTTRRLNRMKSRKASLNNIGAVNIKTALDSASSRQHKKRFFEIFSSELEKAGLKPHHLGEPGDLTNPNVFHNSVKELYLYYKKEFLKYKDDGNSYDKETIKHAMRILEENKLRDFERIYKAIEELGRTLSIKKGEIILPSSGTTVSTEGGRVYEREMEKLRGTQYLDEDRYRADLLQQIRETIRDFNRYKDPIKLDIRPGAYKKLVMKPLQRVSLNLPNFSNEELEGIMSEMTKLIEKPIDGRGIEKVVKKLLSDLSKEELVTPPSEADLPMSREVKKKVRPPTAFELRSFQAGTGVTLDGDLSIIKEFQKKIREKDTHWLGVDGIWGDKSAMAWAIFLEKPGNEKLKEAVKSKDGDRVKSLFLYDREYISKDVPKGREVSVNTSDPVEKLDDAKPTLTPPISPEIPGRDRNKSILSDDAKPTFAPPISPEIPGRDRNKSILSDDAKPTFAPPISPEAPAPITVKPTNPESGDTFVEVRDFVVSTMSKSENPKGRDVALLRFKGDRPEGLAGSGEYDTAARSGGVWSISSVSPVERRMLILKSKNILSRKDLRGVRKKLRRDNRTTRRLDRMNNRRKASIEILETSKLKTALEARLSRLIK